mmetsp:Transcript_22505/g.18810  ORF Transcript_22505/g.18810 Transcript_22505/m.18810 type:complete len:92 (+) Transcript_22505:2-277(+)
MLPFSASGSGEVDDLRRQIALLKNTCKKQKSVISEWEARWASAHEKARLKKLAASGLSVLSASANPATTAMEPAIPIPVPEIAVQALASHS